jgi:hypothetical protein
MHDHSGSHVPRWVAELLKEQPASTPAARERIMSVVRTMSPARTLAAPMRRSRWLRRGVLSPVGSAAATILLLLAGSLRMSGDYLLGTSFEQSAIIVGDTIVDRVVSSAGGGGLHDTLRDTLRIVEFVVRGRGVERVEVAGEYDGWRTTALQKSDNGNAWRARLVVPRDALRFAFLVNNERRIPATPLRVAATNPDSI